MDKAVFFAKLLAFAPHCGLSEVEVVAFKAAQSATDASHAKEGEVEIDCKQCDISHFFFCSAKLKFTVYWSG